MFICVYLWPEFIIAAISPERQFAYCLPDLGVTIWATDHGKPVPLHGEPVCVPAGGSMERALRLGSVSPRVRRDRGVAVPFGALEITGLSGSMAVEADWDRSSAAAADIAVGWDRSSAAVADTAVD